MAPPTMATLDASLLAQRGQGVYTFSNGTDWECWASGNCYACRWWDPDEAGTLCAFECAAFLDMVSPELARLFGWIRNADNAQDGERFGWDAPDQCAFFRERSDDDRPEPPPTDPLQLVLIADPTEDLALVVEPAPDLVEAVA